VKAGLALCGHLLTFLEERQQVGVNRVGLSRGHAVGKVLVTFERAIPQQFCRQRSGRDLGNDLIVFAVHHEDGNGDLLQVFGEIRLGEGDDAVIVRFGPAYHALAPPVQDDCSDACFVCLSTLAISQAAPYAAIS